MKYPYLKFYIRDWTGDQQLRMVSLSARGLWLECICIMHTAKRYGYLETPTGAPFEDETMSRLIGTSKDDLYRLKSELLTAGIPSVEDVTGIWFSRRMVKEQHKAEKCSEAGKKGGGNPSLASHPNTSSNDIQIPDTRNHISIKDTFKGDVYTSFKTWSIDKFEEVCKSLFQGLLDETEAKAFFKYWTEPSPRGKMRFQLGQTWDTKRRMETWARNCEARQAKKGF